MYCVIIIIIIIINITFLILLFLICNDAVNYNNNRLFGSCSRTALLDNDTYTYICYEIQKIHNNSHTTEDVRTVIYVKVLVIFHIHLHNKRYIFV